MQRQQPKTITLLGRKLLVNGASRQGAQSHHAPSDNCGILGDALVTHACPQKHVRQLWSMLSLVVGHGHGRTTTSWHAAAGTQSSQREAWHELWLLRLRQPPWLPLPTSQKQVRAG